jgi:uncharacterized protein (DUF927 family)
MTDFDLLDTVLAPEGWFAVVGIKGKSVQQELVQTREEVDEVAQRFLDEERNVYFGCAKYETNANRKQENAKYFKAFWMDIDCGPDKGTPDPVTGKIEGYLDQATGLKELKRFCETLGLPRPTLVDSGRGLHVYWVLDEVISREQWEPVSNRLKDLCAIHNLIADNNCFEPARVLRIPGTLNFKDSPPSEVSTMVLGRTTNLAEMREILNVVDAPKKMFTPRPSKERSALTLSLMGNRVSKFKKIMLKSANGEGCQQLVHCYQNQESISYDLWRSALSIAAFCEEGATAAHKMSEKYPGYDPEEVEIKVHDLQKNGGPHFCDTFEKNNPGGCDGCQFKGKITTPILLGKEIATSEVDEEGNYVVEDDLGEEEEETTQRYIPAFPYPFFRGAKGGIYLKSAADGEDDKLVYEHDLYVVKTLKDPAADNAMSALIRVHLPKDGMDEFSVPLEQIVGKESPLKKLLARRGVVGFAGQMENLTYFVQASVKELQYAKRAEIMRAQFGWADTDSKFIVGDREITAEGIYYSPPSMHTKGIAQWMNPVGTLEKWQEVFNLYNRPGLEPNAFAAFTAFGSPLLKFMGLNGAIINVIFRKSGSGKSTTLYMCNSVWGHPEKLVSIPRDTINARMQRLGVMNNLPFTMDEITNMSAEDFSDLSYAMSQGRGKDRQKAQSNELRTNLTSWQNLSLASSNASFEEKLSSLKNTPDGELMRFIEYEIGYSDAIGVEEGKQMFDHQLRENYGHAGDIYAQWLVANRDEAIRIVLSVQAKIDKELRLTQRERFWSAQVACNLAGALIAQDIGLIDYDMPRVYKWVCQLIRELRETSVAPPDTASNVIGDYINRHIRNALIVNGEADSRTKLTAAPVQEPYGALLIRYEPDTKQMFIVSKHFKDDCVKSQINFRDLLKQLTKKGIYKGSTTRRMTTGSKIKGTPVHVIHLDCNAPDFISLDDYVSTEGQDAGSGGGVPDQLEEV